MSTRVDATVGKHAFLVMAHKDDEVLHTLMRILDDERNDIFIHMDAKKGGWDEHRLLASVSKAGIFLVPRIRVTWGGIRKSPVKSTFSTPQLQKDSIPITTF